jgi:3-hydroxyisobutyrate dehydrogenase-like beta-hydroxyacid dehydrogenase
MGSVFTKYKSPAFVNLDFTPTFTPTLLRKDFDLGMHAASELDVSMPVSALCTEIVKASEGAGYTDDFAILLLESARASGLKLEPENVVVDDGLSGTN